jgi:hypothetical protein
LILKKNKRNVDAMQWTHDGTIRNALWLGGGQWAGKTTVAGLLTDRYDLVHYHFDFHAARGHDDRRVAAAARRGEPFHETDWEQVWIGPTPAEMAAKVLAGFPENFAWVLDDLRGIVTRHPVLADGWGLRPELVTAVADPSRMVVMVPTDEWRHHQARTLPRAARIGHDVSDQARATRARVERDRLIAEDAVRKAGERGVRVIEVDGTRPPDAIAAEIAEHFRLTPAPRR